MRSFRQLLEDDDWSASTHHDFLHAMGMKHYITTSYEGHDRTTSHEYHPTPATRPDALVHIDSHLDLEGYKRAAMHPKSEWGPASISYRGLYNDDEVHVTHGEHGDVKSFTHLYQDK